MAHVRIYTTSNCPYCVRAMALFTRLGAAYEEIDLTRDDALRAKLSAENNWRTVPMIFIGDTFVGGYDDLSEMHRAGKLQALLAAES